MDQGLPVAWSPVEQVEFERNLTRHILDLMDTPKPSHQVLKRYGLAGCTGGDNLPLDEKLRPLHLCLGKINNLRNTISHIRQSSTEDPDLVVFSVNLDSRPVELVFKSCPVLVFSKDLFSVICH